MIDFSQIRTSLSCYSNSRIPDMYATALNILSNTTNNFLVVNINTKYLSDENLDRLAILLNLAKVTQNEVKVNTWPEEMSLAQMYYESFEDLDSQKNFRPYWLSVDDDLFIPTQTLNILSKVSKLEKQRGLYLYGFYEVINYRGYKDWSPEIHYLRDIPRVIKEYGQKALLHRLFKVVSEQPDIIPLLEGLHCGSFMFCKGSLSPEKEKVILDTLKVWPKGKRGVDKFICETVGNPYWIHGANAYHTDRTKKHIDNKMWTEDVEKLWLGNDGD